MSIGGELSATQPGDTSPGSSVESPAEPCPAPLSWWQVVSSVREGCEDWSLQREGRTVSGVTFGCGPPLYFLGGPTARPELYFLTFWLLREEFCCIAIDAPPPQKLSRSADPLATLAGDVKAVAGLHRHTAAAVAAVSSGGAVALEAMRSCPRLIERAIIFNGFARRRWSLVEKLLIRLGRMTPGRLKRTPFWTRIQEHNHLPWFPPFDESRWQFYLDQAGSVPIARFAGNAAVAGRVDLRGRLAEIKQPVLLIGCEGEGRVGEQSRIELAAGLANATMEILPSCGTLPYLTHPHRLAKLIREFAGGAVQGGHLPADIPGRRQGFAPAV